MATSTSVILKLQASSLKHFLAIKNLCFSNIFRGNKKRTLPRHRFVICELRVNISYLANCHFCWWNCISNIIIINRDLYTAQKMKFSIKDFFSKYDQIRRKLRIWSHLLKKSLMENFISCAVLFPLVEFILFNPIQSSNLVHIATICPLFFYFATFEHFSLSQYLGRYFLKPSKNISSHFRGKCLRVFPYNKWFNSFMTDVHII